MPEQPQRRLQFICPPALLLLAPRGAPQPQRVGLRREKRGPSRSALAPAASVTGPVILAEEGEMVFGCGLPFLVSWLIRTFSCMCCICRLRFVVTVPEQLPSVFDLLVFPNFVTEL